MAERGFLSDTKEAEVERSTEEIRQDIAKGEENISQTVEQIGERIKEKLDWRGYVRDSPYWALGVAAGLGYLASRVFKKRATPMERIMGSLTEVGRDSLGGVFARAAGPGLIKVTLLGVATKAAASWIKNATATAGASGGAGPRPQTGGGSTISPRAETQKSIQIKN
jgi:ElaB/YqjD/DUF883 family membrane-anchored ribosome-binding protein